MHRTNPGGQGISDDRLNIGFTQVPAQKKMYTEWQKCGKDPMMVRGFAPAGRTNKDFPDANILPIYTGMRTLCPACDLIVSAVAANDMHRLEDIEVVVVELVKDSCWKLNDIKNKGKMVVANPGIAPAYVVVHASLLPPGAPNQWGAATPIGNPGHIPPNPPPAHVLVGRQLRQARPGAAGANVPAAQVNVPAAEQVGQAPLSAAGLNVPAAQVIVPAGGQLGQAPPRAAGPNIAAAQVKSHAAGQLGQAPPGAAVPNVPAAGQLRAAPSGEADPNVPAAQVNLPAAGQRGQAPPDAGGPKFPAAAQLGQAPRGAAGPNVPAAQVNVPAADTSHRLPRVMFLRRVRMYLFNLVMILRTNKWYVIQVHRIMTLHWRKCYLTQNIMALWQSKTNLLPGAFPRHPTVGLQVSHFLNHQPVSGCYLLTYEIQIGALYLGVRAPCVSFMSCHSDVVWHYPSLKGIR